MVYLKKLMYGKANMFRQLTYDKEIYVMNFGKHASSHFFVSIRKWRQAEIVFRDFAGPNSLLVLANRGTCDAG
jgi:hypothetical protein